MKHFTNVARRVCTEMLGNRSETVSRAESKSKNQLAVESSYWHIHYKLCKFNHIDCVLKSNKPKRRQNEDERKTIRILTRKKCARCDLPFDFVFDFRHLNDIVVLGLLENRFNRIEAHEFDFGGTFAGPTFRCDGRCGARAGCDGYRWRLKYI